MKYDLSIIKYVVIDVDGTMTDAGIYYDEHGNELKKFCTRDAAAFFAAKKAGIKIIVLTGRECEATKKRMIEMQVDYLLQNVKDKAFSLKDFMATNSIQPIEVGYIGDDLNDYAPMKLVGFKACPADSCKEIKEICDYVSIARGGYGVIRDIFENVILKSDWRGLIDKIYETGI